MNGVIEFAWPWAWLALPLPWLVRQLMRPARTGEAALWVPFMQDFQGLSGRRRMPYGMQGYLWLAILAWLLLLTAVSRPQWLDEEERLPITGRNMMLAVDLSLSMRENDMVLAGWGRVNRLTMIKYVAGKFIERRKGDRIGLILFGDRPYLQAPLTFDLATVHTLLEEAEIGFLGKSTAIGDAIGLAIRHLRDSTGEHVLILLTDGANTSGEMQPLPAARYAAQAGLKIYTIGVGADEKIISSLFGRRRVNPSRDLDEQTLQQVAELTGGRYFRARNSQELEQIYLLLNTLEPASVDLPGFRPQTALFFWPLSLALVIVAALLWCAVPTAGSRSGAT